MQNEPRTLQEMHARFKAARQRMWTAGTVQEAPSRIETPKLLGPDRTEDAAIAVIDRLSPPGCFPCNARRALQRVTDDLRRGPAKKLPPLAATILEEVEAEYEISTALILGTTRLKAVVRARQELCLRLRDAGYSLPRIGMMIGRDHTTVLHGCRKAEARHRG